MISKSNRMKIINHDDSMTHMKALEIELALKAQREKETSTEIEDPCPKQHLFISGYVYDRLTQRYYKRSKGCEVKLNSRFDTVKLDNTSTQLSISDSSANLGHSRPTKNILCSLFKYHTAPDRFSRVLFDQFFATKLKINHYNLGYSLHSKSSFVANSQYVVSSNNDRFFSISCLESIHGPKFYPSITYQVPNLDTHLQIADLALSPNNLLAILLSDNSRLKGSGRLMLFDMSNHKFHVCPKLNSKKVMHSIEYYDNINISKCIYICENDGISKYSISSEKYSNILRLENRESNPVKTYNFKNNSDLTVVGFRNGVIQLLDERISNVNNIHSNIAGKMSYCVNHIAGICNETKLVAEDITGNIVIFDIRKSGLFKQIKFSQNQNLVRNRKFWISNDDRLLVSSLDNQSFKSNCTDAELGIWSLTNNLTYSSSRSLNDDKNLISTHKCNVNAKVDSTHNEDNCNFTNNISMNQPWIRLAGNSQYNTNFNIENPRSWYGLAGFIVNNNSSTENSTLLCGNTV